MRFIPSNTGLPVAPRNCAGSPTMSSTPSARTAAPPPTLRRLLRDVSRRTGDLMACWMAVGFMHGVNTDNMSILGLTLDYGPFGFMEAFGAGHICCKPLGPPRPLQLPEPAPRSPTGTSFAWPTPSVPCCQGRNRPGGGRGKPVDA